VSAERERLSQDEIALVLRRAAELDVEPVGGPEPLTVEAVEAAAAEVGLPAVAVRQAVAELRAGLLTDEASAAPSPHAVVEAAVVPLDPAVAADVVGRWLGAQTFHRYRGRDGVEVWRIREDWVANVQRRFDWAASMRLKDVREVVVRTVAVEGGTLVRLEATLEGSTTSAPGVGAGAGGVLGSGAGILVGAAVAGGPAVLVVGAAVAGIGAVGGWRVGTGVKRSRSARIAEELGAELDRIATGQDDQRAYLRFRERARRHRGTWA
jgi:hypothetical protein